MQTLLLLTVALLARSAYGDNICAVYDEQGNKLGSDPHFMGTFPKDVKPGDVLPGRLMLENFKSVTLKSGTCNLDYFKHNMTLNLLKFEVTEKFQREGLSGDECMFVLQADKGDGCPDAVETEFRLKYLVRGEMNGQIFTQENYTFQMSFPVSKGTIINEDEIVVTDLNSSAVRLELQDPFDGIEIVSLDSSADRTHSFQLRATKLLYLLEDLRSVLVAKNENGEIIATVPFTLRMNEDSAVPKAEFEKSFYDVSVQASQLNPSANICPVGMIKLKETYNNLDLDVRTLNEPDSYFEVLQLKDNRNVDIRIKELSKTDLTSRDILLQLTARLTNVFGFKSEAFAFLIIRVNGNPGCVSSDGVENKEQLAMIVLSVIVAVLLLVIIYLYFKYVRARKSQEPAVQKTPGPPVVKHRRPTPRLISEYPYPLDNLPKPLATVTEAEEDSKDDNSNKGQCVEIKIENDEVTVKPRRGTRKRSVSFVYSDLEARLHRESGEYVPDWPVGEESPKRNVREQEERRRRKSSVKMYRCLT